MDEVTGKVRMDWDYHPHPAPQPFTVEPPDAVIRAGETVGFVASFCQLGSFPAGGVVVGTQKLYSPDSKLTIRTWEGEGGEMETRLEGAFHPNAAPPVEDPKPLKLRLSVGAHIDALSPPFRFFTDDSFF